MSKITILWIEDNPLPTGFNELPIKAQRKFPLGYSNWNDEYSKYFNLKILQHPDEIIEYLEMSNIVAQRESHTHFSNTLGIMPEIVVFDYRLADNWNKKNEKQNAIDYNLRGKWLREKFNPCYLLKSSFNELFHDWQLSSENKNLRNNSFLKKLTDIDNNNISDLDFTDDEFGLYAGVAVIRFFQNYISCGVPASVNKPSRTQLSTNGKFFEVINDYDLKGAFYRKFRGNKLWNYIIEDGTKLLRDRILELITTNKIRVDLEELIEIANCNINSDSVLTLYSSYGVHKLPLGGLFVKFSDTEKEDKNEIDQELKNRGISSISKRNYEIYIYANIILTEIYSRSAYHPSAEIIQKSRYISNELWKAFRSNLFLHRLNFSKFSKLKKRKEKKLTSSAQRQYNLYVNSSKYFETEQKGKKNTANTGKTRIAIIKPIVELNNFLNKKMGDTKSYTKTEKQIITWASLFIILKLYKARRNWISKERNAGILVNISPPTEEEIFCLFFPIASHPIILPIHGGDKYEMKKFTKNLLYSFNQLLIADKNFFQAGTKYILQCYANSIGLFTYKEENHSYLPEWLK